jgi:acetyltransferase
MNQISSLLEPKSVAIIGASSNPAKLGWQILSNLKQAGFSGNIYPINLKESQILGYQAYGSISELTGKVDLAVVVIPAQFVLAELKKVAQAGCHNVIIISAGFGEAGAAGQKMENEIKFLAQEYKLNILGPNCLGLINYNSRLNLTFAKMQKEEVKKGHNIAFLSQSGAIGSAVLDWTANKNIGFSLFVSLGNKAGLNETDFFEYLLTDKKTDLVVLYLEEISAGSKWLNLVSRLSQIKPVAILKAGRTNSGISAAKSHTGSLAGDSAITATALERSGAIILRDLNEMFNLMRLIKKPLDLNGSGLHIVSNAGGPVVLSADEAAVQGLALPDLSPTVSKKIAKILPSFGHARNPLDILGDATSERYGQALEVLLADSTVQALLVLLTPQSGTDSKNIAEIVGQYSLKYPNKLVVTSFMGALAISDSKKILADYLVPNFDYPEEAIRVLAHYLNWQKQKKTLAVYNPAQEGGFTGRKAGLWDYLESQKLLAQNKIQTVKTVTTFSQLKYPAVVKIVGPKIVHKSEAQAIHLNVANLAGLKKILSGSKLLKQKGNYAVAQTMVKDGLELIIGCKRDANFGPVVVIGWGGIYTEIIKDAQMFLAEDNSKMILTALKRLKVYNLLRGARGDKGYDIAALVKLISQVVKLIQSQREIKELDLNPVFVLRRGTLVADWRLIS